MNPNDFDSKRRFVIQYGRFSVYHDPLVHRPYGLYRITAGDKYVGAQLSYPSKSDCEWISKQKNGAVVYATHSFQKDNTRLHYMRGATSAAGLRWRKENSAA